MTRAIENSILRNRISTLEAALATARKNAQEILDTISVVEQRCLVADGPVTKTLQEITESELRKIYKAAKALAALKDEG